MDKLEKLLKDGWIVSAYYDDKFHLIAVRGGAAKSTYHHADLEMAVIELYEKCKASNDT